MSDNDEGPRIHVIGLDDNENIPDFIKEMLKQLTRDPSGPSRMSMTVMADLIKKASMDAYAKLEQTASLAGAAPDQFFIMQKSIGVILMAFTDQCCAATHVSDTEMANHILKHMTKAVCDAVVLRKELKVGKKEHMHDKASPSHIESILERQRTAANRK